MKYKRFKALNVFRFIFLCFFIFSLSNINNCSFKDENINSQEKETGELANIIKKKKELIQKSKFSTTNSLRHEMEHVIEKFDKVREDAKKSNHVEAEGAAMLQIISCYKFLGDLTQAKNYCKKIVDNPEYYLKRTVSIAHLFLGNIAILQENFSKAKDYFEIIIAKYPKQKDIVKEAKLWRAHSYALNREYEKAKIYYTEIESVNSEVKELIAQIDKLLEIAVLYPSHYNQTGIITDTIENTQLKMIAQIDPLLSESYNLKSFLHYTDTRLFPQQKVGIRHLADFKLYFRFKTQKLPEYARSHSTVLYLQIIDKEKILVSDTKDIRVHRKREISYDEKNWKHVENCEWEEVSGVFHGGVNGSEVAYTESHKSIKKRSINMSPQFSLGLKFISAGFGIDIQKDVESEKSIRFDVKQKIPPNEKAIWHRRCEKMEKRADLMEWSDIGEKTKIGDLVLTDWLFIPFLRTTKNGLWEKLPE